MRKNNCKENRISHFYSLQGIARKRKMLALLLFFSFLTACSFNEIFYEFYSFSHSKWDKKASIRFNVPIEDTSTLYDIFFELRHTNSYPFRNLYLFVNHRIHNKESSQQDTICIELADKYGKWYGKGIHLHSYTFPYRLNVQYPDTGIYVYTIRQGMLKSPLKGISDFGLRIVKKHFNKYSYEQF